MAAPLSRERYHKRIKHDITEIYADPVEGIYVAPDDERIHILHALIVGPKDTPYEGGFFYFVFTYPENYPLKPPSVRFMTTGNGKVRFNPNLYACGKVCLSILNTWTGPSWTSVMTTKSVLISLQSLIMNENPFFNEPGYESHKNTEHGTTQSNAYNYNIKYQTLRVAVIDMVANCRDDSFAMPSVLKEMVVHLFSQNCDSYLTRLTQIETSTPPERVQQRNKLAFLSSVSITGSADQNNWTELRRRLNETIASLKSGSQENIAMQLYQSLREAYVGRPVGRPEGAPEDQQLAASELFNPEDGDDDCLVIDPYSSDDDDDDDDDVQIIEGDEVACAQSSTTNQSKESSTKASTSSAN